MTSDSATSRIVRRASMALAAAMLVAVALTPASADTQAQLDEAEQQVAALEQEIARSETAVQDLQAEIDALSERLAVGQQAYNETQQALMLVRADYTATETAYGELRARLESRARDALILNSGTQLGLILDSDSFNDMGDRVEFLNQLQVADAALAAQVAAAARDLERTRATLEASLQEQTRIVARLATDQDRFLTALTEQQDELDAIAMARREAATLVSKLDEKLAAEQLTALNSLEGGRTAPYGVWADGFLRHIGAPTCHDNMVALVAWQTAEGTTAAYNPLATTLPMPGATVFNSVGVRNYVSLKQGVEAIRLTLTNGSPTYGYAAVLDALSRCAPAMETGRAINASSWCAGCTNGQYVIGIIPLVETYFDRYASTQAS